MANDNRKPKAMVTGGSGFLGSHVADALARSGYQVVILDLNPATTYPVRKVDLNILDEVKAATQDVDYICHLGGVGDVYLAMDKPYLASASNVLGTCNIMEAALKNGVKKVIYASTWEVYGKPVYQPMDEEHPCAPEHFYGITKLAGEQMSLAYDRLKGVPALALRLGTAYGTRMRPNSVFSIFVDRAAKGEPLIVKGSGKQSRQFTHASDIARGFLLAMEADTRGVALNLASNESITISQLAETVCRHLPTEVKYEEERIGEVPSAKVTSEKARRLLGWKAETNFLAGMKELITYRLQAVPKATKG